MTRQTHAVAFGEYVGGLESLEAAIKKLHPNAILKSERVTRFYFVEESLDGQSVQLTIGVTAGITSDDSKWRYDVYFIGTSADGYCNQLVNRIVTEAGISVITGRHEVDSKFSSNQELIGDIIGRQIEEITERQHF